MTVSTSRLHNWPELLSSVTRNDGVAQVSMATLRELEGRQRAGKHIRQAIQDKLTALGLGFLPEELPNRQQQTVLLYRLGTPAAEMVQALKQSLTEPSPPESAYTLLHRLNTMPDPEEVVHRDEVEATVNKEVGDALQQTAQSVLAMLAKAHPEGSGESVDPTPFPMGNTSDTMDLVAALERSLPAPDPSHHDGADEEVSAAR